MKDIKWFLKIAVAGIIFCFVFSCPALATVYAEDETGKPQLPPYAPGQIIIKFKDAAGTAINNKASSTKGKGKAQLISVQATNLTSIDALNAKYKVKNMAPVFQALKAQQLQTGKTMQQLSQATSARFPKREARSPKNVTIPNLANIYKLELEDQKADIKAICEEYKKDPNVEYCEPNYIMKLYSLPNDTYVDPDQDGNWSTGAWGQAYEDLWGLKRIKMEQAWQITQGGSDIIVAVSDTGVDYNHPDIATNIWTNPGEISNNGIDDDGNGYIDDTRGYDFTTCAEFGFLGFCNIKKSPDNEPMDDVGHGTHVAGTIAALTNNNEGIAGICPKCKIMPVKGLSPEGGYLSDLMNTIVYATDNGADIINMSWGGELIFPGKDPLEDVINYAYAQGVVLIAAAGNSAQDVESFSPAHLNNVITVSSTNHEDYLSSFSNYGKKIDLAAPGGDGNADSWTVNRDRRAKSYLYYSSSKIGAYALLRRNSYSLPHNFLSIDKVILHTVTGPDRGIISVFVNDRFVNSIDNYAPTVQFVQKEISYPDKQIINTGINIRFQISSNKNPASLGYRMDIDTVIIKSGRMNRGFRNFYYDDGGDRLNVRNILSLRANNTDMYGDGYSIVGSNYYRSRGTSMAAPHVAGVAALILSRHPEFSNEQVRAALQQSADDLGTLGFDDHFGSGRLNAYKALLIDNPIVVHIAKPCDGTHYSKRQSVEIYGSAYGGDFQNATIEVGKEGISPTKWTILVSSTTPILNDKLATWNTANTIGFYTIRLTVKDKNDKKYSNEITAGVTALSISPIPHKRIVHAGKTYTLKIAGRDRIDTDLITLSAIGLPEEWQDNFPLISSTGGLVTQDFSFTPVVSQIGKTYWVKFVVKDNFGNSASTGVIIIVVER